ncbi:MAG: PsiF family protein [Pseudoxanthomonas sp.]
MSASLLVLTALALPATSFAATAQQQRMAQCSAQNKGKKGDEYKAAQKACLSGQTATPTAAAPSTPQERMKSCNADASSQKLTGDARKTFMSTCLKKS